jgi:hypothetical protein
VKSKKIKLSRNSNDDKENRKVYKQIPKPLKKKHPYSGRVGAKADQMKKHMYVNLSLQGQDHTQKRKRRLSHTHGGKKKPVVPNDISLAHQSKASVDHSLDENSMSTSKHTSEMLNNEKTADSEEPVITMVTKSNWPIVKRRMIVLQENDYNIIEHSNGWLTGSIISAVNMTLHNQFPMMQGLQDTTLGETLEFDKPADKFIQILHSSSNHWVMVSNIGCCAGQLNYYDSLYHSITPSVKRQIRSLYADEIKVNIMPVQQQTNGSDCGIFAVAFTASLLHGQDPCQATYDTTVMRYHLKQCLRNKHFQIFPSSVKPVVRCGKYKSVIRQIHKKVAQAGI